MKALKKTMLGAAALAAIATMAMASPAAAQPFYAYPRLYNDQTSPNTITISGVSWSGSYSPQIGSVAAGGYSDGTLKTVLSYGYGGLTFNANLNDSTRPGAYCYFTFNISNTTGVVYPVGKVAYLGARCEATFSGPNNEFVDFRAW